MLIYPTEYMCTKELIIKTGINIETVKLSNWKLHTILIVSVTSHSNKIIEIGLLFNPTSKKANIDNIVVIIILKVLIIRDPYIPDILPKNPEIIDPNNGNNIMDKYIIYIL